MKKSSNIFFNRTTSRWIGIGIIGITVSMISINIYKISIKPDQQCTTSHAPTTQKPITIKTATDYLTQGDWEYEKGDCDDAITSYSKAIEMNPEYAEAYNNRAYTYMRMRDYPKALTDLDKAIDIRPKYIHARMNRGDIYNYYYAIDREKAIIDYNVVLSLGRKNQLGVCGHRLLAKNNGWNFNVLFQLLTKGPSAGCVD
jgi:tetratricopeptide (TPR) repeat protein